MDVSGPASLESLESRAILLLLLVFISKSLSSFLHKIGVTWLSETAVYMVTGLSAALLLSWKSLLPGAGVGGAGNGEGEGYLFRMSSRFFYMALLPPIVFEVGWNAGVFEEIEDLTKRCRVLLPSNREATRSNDSSSSTILPSSFRLPLLEVSILPSSLHWCSLDSEDWLRRRCHWSRVWSLEV